MLVNITYVSAATAGPLFKLVSCLMAKLDDLSHGLAWALAAPSRDAPLAVSLVEFPRLGLKFRVRAVGGNWRLESIENKGLWFDPTPPESVADLIR